LSWAAVLHTPLISEQHALLKGRDSEFSNHNPLNPHSLPSIVNSISTEKNEETKCGLCTIDCLNSFHLDKMVLG
jgi:hypothetical protein